jgi:hypothetical protein
MKDGGATNEYTAKRVMSRIKAGNFKDGGRAELLRDRRMKDIEKDYKIALAKGKNEGVAKAKYEQRMADAADDYAKRTKGDRTKTKAGEKAAEAALTEARRTKGESIKKRDMAADINKFFAGKDMAPKAAEPAKAAAPAAAKPKVKTTVAKTPAKRVVTPRTVTPAAAAAPAPVATKPPATTAAPKPPVTTAATKVDTKVRAPSTRTGLNPNSIAGMISRGTIPNPFKGTRATNEEDMKAYYAQQAKAKPKSIFAGLSNPFKGTRFTNEEDMKRYYAQQAAGKAKGGKVEKYAAGGAGKVRKGMMKGK